MTTACVAIIIVSLSSTMTDGPNSNHNAGHAAATAQRRATGFQDCFSDQDCDDGNACTQDVCDFVETVEGEGGFCNNQTIQCDDGDPCNGFEFCDSASGCQPGEPFVCDDGDACTVDTCLGLIPEGDGGTVDCAHDPIVCDDGDLCNGLETCDPSDGCLTGEPLNCDDDIFCNGIETCAPASGCVAGTNPCTDPNFPLCNEESDRCDPEIREELCIVIDFETEVTGTPLVNGQDISSPPEFGSLIDINALPGAHLGAAIFDSDPDGPNVGGLDEDLLVDSGNVLILQDATPPFDTQTVAGIFDTPNDAPTGGTINFEFAPLTGVRAVSIVVADFEESPATFLLTDTTGLMRAVTVPAGFTGDEEAAAVSLLTISSSNSVDTVLITDEGFNPDGVKMIQAVMTSSGALDDLTFCINLECASNDECADDDPCTQDICGEGICLNRPIEGCVPCGGELVCDDADPCTDDTCDTTAGICSYLSIPGCCDDDEDCAPNQLCNDEAGRCECVDDPECCVLDEDCDGIQVCDPGTGTCVCNGQPGCCMDDEDCSGNKTCDEDSGRCICDDVAECCQSDEDCAADRVCDPETGRCVCDDTPGCCESSEDCAGNKVCDDETGRCLCDDVPECCEDDGDCPENRVCDPATGRCVCDSVPGCCSSTEDCSGNKTCDGDTGRCVCDDIPNCCEDDDDCAANRVCDPGTGRCVCDLEPDCCESIEDCAAGKICDEQGRCVCETGAPCDDGSSCTTNDTCMDGACIGTPIPNCGGGGGGGGGIDRDGDSVVDGDDNCPDTANGPNRGTCTDGSGGCLNDTTCENGGICSRAQEDLDEDGIGDVCDPCPADELDDRDGDGVCDSDDGCPMDPDKIEEGACGCNTADADSDGDGSPDCTDPCPDDPDKDMAGVCGCDVADTDDDGDGVADCIDDCPADPDKTEPGVCGCGNDDIDSDGDGVCDEPVEQPDPPTDNGQEQPPVPAPAQDAPEECGCGLSSPLLGMAMLLGLGFMKLGRRQRRHPR